MAPDPQSVTMPEPLEDADAVVLAELDTTDELDVAPLLEEPACTELDACVDELTAVLVEAELVDAELLEAADVFELAAVLWDPLVADTELP